MNNLFSSATHLFIGLALLILLTSQQQPWGQRMEATVERWMAPRPGHLVVDPLAGPPVPVVAVLPAGSLLSGGGAARPTAPQLQLPPAGVGGALPDSSNAAGPPFPLTFPFVMTLPAAENPVLAEAGLADCTAILSSRAWAAGSRVWLEGEQLVCRSGGRLLVGAGGLVGWVVDAKGQPGLAAKPAERSGAELKLRQQAGFGLLPTGLPEDWRAGLLDGASELDEGTLQRVLEAEPARRDQAWRLLLGATVSLVPLAPGDSATPTAAAASMGS